MTIKVVLGKVTGYMEDDIAVDTYVGLLDPTPSAPNGIVHIISRDGGNRFINLDSIIEVH